MAATQPATTVGSGCSLTTALLIPLGSIALVAYAWIGSSAETWRTAPIAHASFGLLAGAAYLAAVWRVLARPGGRHNLAVILGFALAFRLASFGLDNSDDLHRYVVEGVQASAGENPYQIAPSQVGAGVVRVLEPGILAGVNHPDWTAIYPPFAVSVEALITRIEPSVSAMALANALFESLAILALLGILLTRGLPTSWILLAAWNPVGPLWFAGEGHNDSLMVLMLALAWLLIEHKRQLAGTAVIALALLAKPFALMAVIPRLRRRPQHALVIGAVALLLYAPYLGAGVGLMRSLGRFGSELHFHGALEPLLRLAWEQAVDARLVRPCVVASLLAILALGTWRIARRFDDELLCSGRLLTLFLLCLPTLHPWYLLVLVPLLPILRSPGLIVWTAMAPVYWLHGVAMLDNGGWTETPAVSAIAHVPAMLILLWELRRERSPEGAGAQ